MPHQAELKATGSQASKDARTLVFDFADFIADHNPLIPDASLLPHPKERLMQAYQTYHAQLAHMKNIDPSRFATEGGDALLNQVRVMWVMLDTYRDIHPEDKQVVDDINLGRISDRLRIGPMLLKYVCGH